ncbi:MAG: formylglycine-generating enzyme family protein [Treponema sp.]|jgi:formylglycine-generating enzyme required for sulfatase activity|nr:formylglycine-generating enzyme family protein [Treponema sp.]
MKRIRLIVVLLGIAGSGMFAQIEQRLQSGLTAFTAARDGLFIPVPGFSLGGYSPNLFKYFGFGLWAEVSALAADREAGAAADALAVFSGKEVLPMVSLFTGPVYRFWGEGRFSLPVSVGVFADAMFLPDKGLLNLGAGALLQAEWRVGKRGMVYVNVLGAYTFMGKGEFILSPGLGGGIVLRGEKKYKITQFNTASQYRAMGFVSAIEGLAGSDKWNSGEYAYQKGVFIPDRIVSLNAYKIAKYETTYELWYEVKTWAQSRGYTFTSAGREGRQGIDGKPPAETQPGAGSLPVTNVSWRDAIVWCNAYSEMAGKTPVYYRDKWFVKVIKSLTDDTVYVNTDASGYRLPTEAEWEAAARGGDPADRTNWTYLYAGSSRPENVMWDTGRANSDIHKVGTKSANRTGLYDMSGNVYEWCWDWYGERVKTGAVKNPAGPFQGMFRILRGGSWYSDVSGCTVSYRYAAAPGEGNDYTGFRVVSAP